MLAVHRFLLTRVPGLYFHLRNVGRKAVGTRRHQRRLFAELVGPGDVVFDVGANIGEFTGAFRDLGARVVAVEPQPRLGAHLRHRFRSDPEVTVVGTAVSDHAGEATLYTTTADALATLEAARATEGTGPGAELEWGATITVPLQTLDALVAAHGEPALVKIDVEGHEHRVVRGLTTVRPTIFFEVNPPGAFDVLDTLAARGYREFFVRVAEQSDWVTRRPMSATDMAAYLKTSQENCDCLALSPEAPPDRRPAERVSGARGR
ncbi:FkbM family methyltransferase [Geodermatophilus sabuli]|uniref:FkbM family methyltransferase n=1 Tax=Geodermatophilus sabuli TaxID=1564158 RepID=A0A7K3VZD7_9ACTN|nr:FkbM family methyltransferase [Geodermatophilus sabuli]NEK58015.1 FkbM family methyltransferase [Geodermatophilus sabuli]